MTAEARPDIWEGDRDKSMIVDPVLRAYLNSDSWWHDCCIRAITWLAELNQPFTAYDLTEIGVPDPDNPHRWGAAFRAAYQQGLIRPVGYAPSRRPSASGSVARVWCGVRAEAEAYAL